MQDKTKEMEIDLMGMMRLFPVIAEIRQISKENNIPLETLIDFISHCAEDLESLSPEDQNLDPKTQATVLLERLLNKIEALKRSLGVDNEILPQVYIQIEDFADFYYGTSDLLEEAIANSLPGKIITVPDDDDFYEDGYDEDGYEDGYDEDDFDDDDYEDEDDYCEEDFDDYTLKLQISLPDLEEPYEFYCSGQTWNEAAMNLVNLIQLLTEDFDL